MAGCEVKYEAEKFSNWENVTDEVENICKDCESSKCGEGNICQEDFCTKYGKLEDHPRFSKILSGALQYTRKTRTDCGNNDADTIRITCTRTGTGTCSNPLDGMLFLDKYTCSQIKKGVSLKEDLTSHCLSLKYCCCCCTCHAACKFTVFAPPTGSSSSAAVINGSIGGVVAFVILAVLLVIFLCRRKHRRNRKDAKQDEYDGTKSFSNTAYDYTKSNTKPITTASHNPQNPDPKLENHEYQLPHSNAYDQIDTPSSITDPVSSPKQTTGHLDNYEFAKPFPLDSNTSHSKYDPVTVLNKEDALFMETEDETNGSNNDYNTMRRKSDEQNTLADEYHHLRDISGSGRDNDDYDKLKVGRKIRNETVNGEYDHCRPRQARETHQKD